jgi:GAF domain-containing protein
MYNKFPKRTTQRDLQLVNAVGDQLAIALQKANLYSDLQAALRRKAIRNHMQNERLGNGTPARSVSHELNNP